MLKILKGNVKFYPGWKIGSVSPITAPNLANIANESRRQPNAFDALGNDATINMETKKEIKQLMPQIDDQPKS